MVTTWSKTFDAHVMTYSLFYTLCPYFSGVPSHHVPTHTYTLIIETQPFLKYKLSAPKKMLSSKNNPRAYCGKFTEVYSIFFVFS